MEGEMSDGDDIVKRLMDYDRCHDGDVDEAADEIVSLRQRLAAAEEALERSKELANSAARHARQAEEAARWCYDALDWWDGQGEALERWPWLAKDTNGGEP